MEDKDVIFTGEEVRDLIDALLEDCRKTSDRADTLAAWSVCGWAAFIIVLFW